MASVIGDLLDLPTAEEQNCSEVADIERDGRRLSSAVNKFNLKVRVTE
jgi:hypothetical protein